MQADIQSLLKGRLGDWLAQQQAMRAEARRAANKRWLWGGIAMAVVIAVIFSIGALGQLRVLIAILGVVGVAIWGYSPISSAKHAMKVGINSAVAREFGLSYSHEVEPGSEFAAAKTYGLLPYYNRDSFEDRWYGTIEGHSFNLYEAHLEEQRGSGKNRRWVTVFRGVIMDMGFGRNFHSTTLLQRAGKHPSWFGLGGRKDHVSFRGHRLDYVDQVHPEFEDIFEVWSDDQVEARTLIHPAYVEQLIALERAFQSDAVRAVFHRGEVVVVVETGNLFESGSMDANEDERKVAQAAAQFTALRSLALAINQNDRGRTLAD